MPNKYQKTQPINELYPCIQGEGRYTGIPHILIRMSGCKLRCQFADSFCDTWYSSWKPEKGSFSLNDIISFYKKNKHIRHTMVTGGGPTANPQLLKELCKIAKSYHHHVTIETEGSEFVQTEADFISLSPKLKSSVPIAGSLKPWGGVVTESEVARHERFRADYSSMILLIESHPDYQLKPVVTSKQDLVEIKDIQDKLKIPNEKVYLMPEGMTAKTLEVNRLWLAEYCIDQGYNFTDRLHIIIYGDKRGV